MLLEKPLNLVRLKEWLPVELKIHHIDKIKKTLLNVLLSKVLSLLKNSDWIPKYINNIDKKFILNPLNSAENKKR